MHTLLINHKQTSMRTNGEIYWQPRTSVDNSKEKKVAVVWSCDQMVGELG